MAAPASRQPAVVGPALIPLGDYASKPPIPLARPVIVIGSRNNCRIHLISSTVSKAHCLLVLTETGCYIADLASRTKTIVNGKPVREQELEDGDTLQIGKFPFRFVAGRTRATGRFPPAPAASLVNEDSPLPVPIDRKAVLIGRRSTADIPLLEESVSTAHAVILERDGKRYLRDLGSRTGTFINGRKIHQEEVRPGDVIRIGETELRYQLDEAPSVEEPEPSEPVVPARVRPATPMAMPIEPTVVETPGAIEPSADAAVEELPLRIDPESQAAETPASEPAEPTHDALADTAIPIAVDDHDELAVMDLEPSEPVAAPEPSVTGPVESVAAEAEPIAQSTPATESPVAEVPPVEETVDELSPRRGWRAVTEPETPVEPIVAEALDETRPSETVSEVEPVAAGVGEEATERRDDTRSVDEGQTAEEPLVPIELPPLRLAEETTEEPVPSDEPRSEEPTTPVIEDRNARLAGSDGGASAAAEDVAGVADTLVAETAVETPTEPEIDLSGFTPTPVVADDESDIDEPAAVPRPLLSLDAPTGVPPTSVVPQLAAEVLEPTASEPESALPTIEPPVTEEAATEVSEPLSDSVFARQVEAFAGEGGEVVAGAPRDEGTERRADEVAAIASESTPSAIDESDAHLRGGEARGEVRSSQEPAAEGEPLEPVATPLDTISAEDEALLSERLPVSPVTADVSPSHVEMPPPVSVDVFSWSTDQAAFHVGGAITLPPVPSDEAERESVAAPGQEVAPLGAATDVPTEPDEMPTSNLASPSPSREPTPTGQAERPPSKKLRGSQRRRRSLRGVEEVAGAAPIEDASAFLGDAPVAPTSIDVFSQVPAVDADELLAAATPEGPEAGPGAGASGLTEPAETAPKPRPTPRPVVPTFGTDPAGLAMAGRPLVARTPDADEQAAAARLVAARRRRLRLVPLLLVAMAALIGGTVWAIYRFVPVVGRVEVSVRFRNIDGLPNEARRREFREQQRQRLASLPVRQAAIANLAGYATPDVQVRPGFLEDPVEYDRVASGAQWIERGDWALRISRRGEDLRADSWRLRAMGDALQQSNRTLLDDARRLRSDVERLDADLARNSARRGELRQSIEAERALGDSKRQLDLELQKLESEIDALESRWAEQSRQVTAMQSELALLRTTILTAPAPDAGTEVPVDAELIALQKQLEQIHESLQRNRAAGQQAATEARRSFEAAVARLQTDLLDVQGTLDASPELKAYVETAQGLLEVTRRLTDDLIHRQQQYFDRLQAFKSQLEEQAQARRSEQWQGDPALRRLQEELEYAKRQLNVATANGLEAEATDAKLQIKLLEERIARRQEELGADPLAVSAILRLEEIIDFTAKAMTEDRARQEKVFEENTRLLKQAAIARLPAEQQELARKLEARMAEINAARRDFAAALSNETTQPAGNAEEVERLQRQAADVAARVEARRKQLAAASAAQLTQQQEQKRQEQIRQKESELASARQKVADLQEQLSVRHRDRRDVARRVSEASLAGERLAQRQQELEEIEQLLEVWQRTRDAKQSELGACVEPLPVSDLDIQLEPGADQRWAYASAAGGGLFILFGVLIAATIRAALHEIPVPDLPSRTMPASSRLGRPATVEPVEKSDEDAHPAAT